MPRLTVEGFPPVEDAPRDETLLAVCEAAGIPMEAACGGFAACNTCRVEVIAGALSPVDESEALFLDGPGQRLGCQARLRGDCAVRLAPG